MTAPDERPDRPEDSDDERAWAELVEAFHAAPDDTGEHRWPEAEDLGPDDDRDEQLPPPTYTNEVSVDDLLAAVEVEDREPGPASRPQPDEAHDSLDHFVPPQPPPIPRGDRVTRLAWAGVLGPPAVVLVAGLASLSVPSNVMVFLALAFIVGFGTLVTRMHGHHPSDPDDGAVL